MSIVSIPLPPGMTSAQFLSYQASMVSTAIVAATAFGIILWDHFYLLPDEIKLYKSSRKEWKSPAPYAFIALRFSGIGAAFAALFFTSIQTNSCQAAVFINSVCMVVAVTSSGVIFTLRTIDIWGNSKLVSAVAGSFLLFVITCWIAVATQYRAINGAPTPFSSNCQLLPFVRWTPISYASSFAFTATLLVLCLNRLAAQRLHQSRAGFTAYLWTLGYLSLTTTAYVAVLIIHATGPEFDAIKRAAAPIFAVITISMGSRVFLNLGQGHTERQRHDERYLEFSRSLQPAPRFAVQYPARPPYRPYGTSGMFKMEVVETTISAPDPYTFPAPPASPPSSGSSDSQGHGHAKASHSSFASGSIAFLSPPLVPSKFPGPRPQEGGALPVAYSRSLVPVAPPPPEPTLVPVPIPTPTPSPRPQLFMKGPYTTFPSPPLPEETDTSRFSMSTVASKKGRKLRLDFAARGRKQKQKPGEVGPPKSGWAE